MKLTIVGASGHGKVVADIAKKCGYTDISFLDNDADKKMCLGYPVIGSVSLLSEINDDVFIAIGNSDVRKELMTKYSFLKYPILIHPNAVVADDVEIDDGSVVMAGSVINPGAKIGKGVIINTCSSVDHDCIIGDYCHIAVGAHLCGNVVVGDSTWVGAGTTINNNVTICGNCMIGAGAVVVKNITRKGTYIGVPAKQV